MGQRSLVQRKKWIKIGKIDGKSNDNSMGAQKRCVLTQLKWYYEEKVFFQPLLLIKKPEVNLFNLFTRRPYLHSHTTHY